ncbi:MAG: hypothetical protein IJO16_06035, partial [Clostridia bacterium]|nr:hypothetical protein [Clostridia bacterium]
LATRKAWNVFDEFFMLAQKNQNAQTDPRSLITGPEGTLDSLCVRSSQMDTLGWVTFLGKALIV